MTDSQVFRRYTGAEALVLLGSSPVAIENVTLDFEPDYELEAGCKCGSCFVSSGALIVTRHDDLMLMEGDADLLAAAPDLARSVEALEAERDAARKALEEREQDMHARIRAGHDQTVAATWSAHCATVEAERDRLRAILATYEPAEPGKDTP